MISFLVPLPGVEKPTEKLDLCEIAAIGEECHFTYYSECHHRGKSEKRQRRGEAVRAGA